MQALKRGCALLLMLAVSAASPAVAAVFSVTPVRIYMSPRDRAVAVTVTNEGDSPVVLQAEVYTWKQTAEGEDELTVSDDLILAPPIVKLAPRARQVVRLARLQPPDASRQLTYRLILREVPELAPSKGIDVPIALALSMPVFITPPRARREMTCDARAQPAAVLSVACENRGSAYAQVREILVKQDERVIGRFEGGAYVLPGARKTVAIKLESAPPPGRLQLVVTYDEGRSESFEVMLRGP